MSTLKKNTLSRRLALLATQKELIFHSSDLGNLWGITNANTLRITLARYYRAGILHRLYRGFYSLLPPKKLDPVLVGAKALHRFCYLSTESVLEKDGYISKKTEAYTFMSEKSAKFSIGDQNYISRQLKTMYLYETEGVIEQNGIFMATTLRAIADMLYFNPKTHFDRPVNWKKVKAIQKKIGYPLTPQRYDAP